MVGAQVFSLDQSELDIAGGIMGRPIEVIEAEYVSLPIPAHAELVVEGLLHAGDTEMEGPLGEFTGYYGNVRAPQPVMEVKAVHSRKSPILTAALMATYPSCEIGAYYAIMRSARILDDLHRIGVPGSCFSLFTSGCGIGLGLGHRVAETTIRRTCGASARVDRPMPGGELLHEVDYRRGRGCRSH